MHGTTTRNRILDAAESIMARKGMRATITEIASLAGVADSAIYQHFKNKEDLLFYTAGRRMDAVVDEVHVHLEGIFDPVSRLSKFIWFRLYYFDSHPDYANLIFNSANINIQ